MINRKGDAVSAQISDMGAVVFTNGEPFRLGQPFCIKNDGNSPIFLDVNLWGMPRGKYISTRFECGWNPEIINEIKPTAAKGLFWGN